MHFYSKKLLNTQIYFKGLYNYKKLSTLTNFNHIKRLCDRPSLLKNNFWLSKIFIRSVKSKQTNYYDLLQISSNATQAQIKQAYYRLSLKYHPDQHQGSNESVDKFREITEAYQILTNVQKRKLYDKGFKYSSVAATPEQQGYAKSSYDTRADGRKAPMTGNTEFYNFDAWYKGHFIRANSDAKHRKFNAENKKLAKEADAVADFHMSIVIFMIIAMFTANYISHLGTEEYDKKKNSKKDSAKKMDR